MFGPTGVIGWSHPLHNWACYITVIKIIQIFNRLRMIIIMIDNTYHCWENMSLSYRDLLAYHIAQWITYSHDIAYFVFQHNLVDSNCMCPYQTIYPKIKSLKIIQQNQSIYKMMQNILYRWIFTEDMWASFFQWTTV